MLDSFIYQCGVLFIALIVLFVVNILWFYAKRILNKQTKIKCLCKHEYEPFYAFYAVKGVEYAFKCRKCGKEVHIQTLTDDKFNWVVHGDG